MAIALTALAASATTLPNHFAQDDVPILTEDARPRSPFTWDQYLNEAYWPSPYLRFLYRPLASLLIGIEWQFGQGSPLPFKVMQLAIYSASCIGVFALALRLLSPVIAVAIGLFFAIHPVHVEAVALAVNQSEVVVGLLTALTVAWYLDRRRRGLLTGREHAGLAGITLIAAHFKESGVMLAALLFVTDLLMVPARTGKERLEAIKALVGWQTLAVAAVLILRSRIEFQATSGTFAAEAFDGMPLGNRALTMLSVVPEWLRLLLWPATLAGDYSPQHILPATGWTTAQTTGALILLLIAVLAWRVRRSAPVVSLGICWTGLALFPVSNVLLPTGIVLAERTLFLPSIGAMLAVGGVIAGLATQPWAIRGWVRLAAGTACALILVMGTSRSLSRHRIWHSSFSFWGQTLVDAPTSYRAWVAFGSLLDRLGHRDRAIHAYEQGVALWSNTSGPIWQLAEWYRQAGDCTKAAPMFARTLELNEFAPARIGLINCQVKLGNYQEARTAALGGIREGFATEIFRTWLRTVDQAIKLGLPPSEVRYNPALTGTDASDNGEIPVIIPSRPDLNTTRK
ncbi:MAG TPA: tetratricopeptide repeat protein [Gemmatimonadales bacterium]|nr:tetratricopeptide repeat protein [Gemmatimonadales bacterium]